MTDSGSDTLATTIVEGNDTTVAQRQLYLTLTLLTGNLTCHGAVYLIRQPVFAGDSLQLKHSLDEFIYRFYSSCSIYILIFPLYGIVTHDGLGRVSEHLCHIKVERLHTISLFEGEMGITGGLTDYIHRGTLTLCDLLYMLNMFLVDEQAHALLTLIGDDLLAGEGLVTNR